MPAMLSPREVVAHLDARHEELIEKLDELNARIEATLAEFARARHVGGNACEDERQAA
jgi:hypothetical protein